MTRTELVGAIHRDLSNRETWERKQGDLYKARFRGLRRTNPPWPNASDINWPLVDSIIEKLKPHYLQQLFANELLASFVPASNADPLTAVLSGAAAQWFDHQVKQESNLETAVIYAIDYQLMLGRPSIKVCWDVDDDRLKFEVVPPDKLIVPEATESLETADRIVHVLTYSPEAYARQPEFKQGKTFIESITGRGTGGNLEKGGTSVEIAREAREGIVQGANDEVIVWEAWTQDEDRTWSRETFSPLLPQEDIRPKAENPYNIPGAPFVDFPNEMTQPDWYAPRGIGEVLLPFQAELTKLLNEKNDAMTLANRPLFRAERDGVEANLRWRPGQILPTGIVPVAMPPPPIAFDTHMNLMREVAEGLAMTPDFGMARQSDMRKARTATEMEQIASMNAQSGDLRMRVFRMSLGRLYQMAWAILKQYASHKLSIWVQDTLVQIPAEALDKDYRIKPSGSADGVTRQRLWQKAVARLQMFSQDPYVDQGELRKSVLEADDAGLVKRLFRDPQTTQATQAEDQAVEIGIMRLGFPAVVTPADDHATHLRTVLLYIQQQHQLKQAPMPGETAMLQQHLAAHLQLLQQKDPEQARQALAAIQALGIAQAGQGQGEEQGQPVEPGNIPPAPEGGREEATDVLEASRGMTPAGRNGSGYGLPTT